MTSRDTQQLSRYGLPKRAKPAIQRKGALLPARRAPCNAQVEGT